MRSCPFGPQTPYKGNGPSECGKHPPQLCGVGPPGQAETRGWGSSTPASPGELHPLRVLAGCIPGNLVLAGGCSPAPSLLVIHSPLLGRPER